MLALPTADVARLEEQRAARGTAEVAVEAERFGGGYMCFSAVGSWSNQVMGAGLSGPVATAEVDRMIDFYRQRGVEPRVELSPFADPSLVAALAERNFVVREFENVLAVDVAPGVDARQAHPYGWPDGLAVRPIDTRSAEELRRFIEVSTSGFRDTGVTLDADTIAIGERIARHPRNTALGAFWDDEMVGAGTVECSGEIAALFYVSVLPKARRRGVQLALMASRLAIASRAGCRVATIGSAPGIPTERNAARLGFEIAYTKVIVVRPEPGLATSV